MRISLKSDDLMAPISPPKITFSSLLYHTNSNILISELLKIHCFLKQNHLTVEQTPCLENDKKQQQGSRSVEPDNKTPKLRNINISLYRVQIHLPKKRKRAFQEPSKYPPRTPQNRPRRHLDPQGPFRSSQVLPRSTKRGPQGHQGQ